MHRDKLAMRVLYDVKAVKKLPLYWPFETPCGAYTDGLYMDIVAEAERVDVFDVCKAIAFLLGQGQLRARGTVGAVVLDSARLAGLLADWRRAREARPMLPIRNKVWLMMPAKSKVGIRERNYIICGRTK